MITMAQTMSAAFFSSEVGRMEEIVQAGLILSLTCFGCNGVPMGRVCIGCQIANMGHLSFLWVSVIFE